MKTLMLAGAAVITLGVGSAYADGGDLIPDTMFTELPGVMASQPQTAPSAVTAKQPGGNMHVYVAHQRTGTWLFPPAQNQGSNG